MLRQATARKLRKNLLIGCSSQGQALFVTPKWGVLKILTDLLSQQKPLHKATK